MLLTELVLNLEQLQYFILHGYVIQLFIIIHKGKNNKYAMSFDELVAKYFYISCFSVFV